MPRLFVDTNLWLYLFDIHDSKKQEAAAQAIRSYARDYDLIVSTQVIVEFSSNMLRKLKFTPSQLGQALSVFDPVLVECTTFGDARLAIDLVEAFSISFWDAHLIAAASRLDCKVLLTEDLQDGQIILGCRIRNPFLE